LIAKPIRQLVLPGAFGAAAGALDSNGHRASARTSRTRGGVEATKGRGRITSIPATPILAVSAPLKAPRQPDSDDEEVDPAEAARRADEAMKRKLSTPPETHDEMVRRKHRKGEIKRRRKPA